MSKTSIFLLGATGYLGSSVLSRLLAHPRRNAFVITVLVRSEEKARKLQDFGVTAVVGSIKDAALVARLAEESHVVFSVADSDDLDLAYALLAGLKTRHIKTGEVPILIHTSGTGVFMWAGAMDGLNITNRIFSDDNSQDINSNIPDSALHRNVDRVVIKADDQGYVRTYIVLPSTIWGIGSNPIISAGIANRFSIQVPALIRASIGRRQAGIVGKGQAIWTGINVNEQAEFYVTLFDAILSRPEEIGHGHDGYYFGENGEYSWYDLGKAIGKALVRRGLSSSDEPTTFSREELTKFFGSEQIGAIWGSNARVRAPHARSIGWKPKLTTRDFVANIDDEVEVIIQRQRQEE